MRRAAASLLLSLMLPLVASCAHTVRYPDGSEWSRRGVTALEEIELNGIAHAVLIRGTDVANPVLLFIHAAGVPSMCFAHLEYAQSGAPIETKLTVVHYDQRGYGKTSRDTPSDASLTVADYVADAEALVEHLRERFHKDKIYVLAESWGSLIGTLLVAKHPEWFHAYISVGQVADVPAYMDDLYGFALTSAEADHNEEALKALREEGKPVATMEPKQALSALFTAGEWADFYLARASVQAGGPEAAGAGFFFGALWDAPEYSLMDFQATAMAFQATQERTVRELLAARLGDVVPSLDVPVYFFMGQHDLLSRSSRAYFDSLVAPSKEWIEVPNAGHMARGDAPAFVEGAIFARVLAVAPAPVASAAGADDDRSPTTARAR